MANKATTKPKAGTIEVAVVPTKVDNSEVLNAISGLTDAVLGLVKKLDKPTVAESHGGSSVTPNRTIPSVTIQSSTLNSPISSTEKFPIPPEYQGLVNTILNKDFGVEISYPSDGVGFNFAILVPKKYSNASEPHWLTYGEDRRNKVIQNAFGINGVREYLELVYNNFGLETKSQIVADRALL